ncbi:MAG: folylpolyglutamate synthase/dihydrofolate synthase family protein [Eubacteriales bacterium]|nr:folylpolyglutamate synthase/dihydrofolate synthase family protein [Eubacteriales bacterium]
MKEYRYHDIINQLSKKGSVPGITTMCRLLECLGHPEKELNIIHIAGTNGKGSTLAFLSSILVTSGYQVGRYISPTIHCYEERFQINGSYMDPDSLEKYFTKIEEVSKQMEAAGQAGPTIFEAETAIALLYFRDHKVDYALIETGMGGLEDATNAINNQMLTLIASISEDHKAILGDTVEKIAAQKAGIIKENTPVILAKNIPSVKEVIKNVCLSKNAPYMEAEEGLGKVESSATGNTFVWKKAEYIMQLAGSHQVDNAATALLAAEQLRLLGASEITEKTMWEGIRNTVWPGRLELLLREPPFYLDGAHNPDGARKLADFLEKHFTNKRIVYIMGVLGDKEYDIMLSMLMPLCEKAYVFTPNNARGLQAERLAASMAIYGKPVQVCENVNMAVESALKENKEADCFVLCGSLSFIEEFRASWPGCIPME